MNAAVKQPPETERQPEFPPGLFLKKLEEERELQPYVTLRAVHAAIALHVEVSASELEQFVWPPVINKLGGDVDDFQQVRINSLRSLLQYSRSARQLHKLLAADAIGLNWYDFAHESTNIIATNAARELGLSILSSLAAAEKRFMREWESAENLLRRTPYALNSMEPPHLEAPRLLQSELIGFKHQEIVSLLEVHKIAHGEPHRSAVFPANWGSGITLPSKTSTEIPTKDTLPDGISHYPNSSELAKAFATILGKSQKQWADMFKSPPQWLIEARVQKGPRGMKGGATWDPLKIAAQLCFGVKTEQKGNPPDQRRLRYREQQVPLVKLDRTFSCHLKPWEKAWHELRVKLESYIT